MIQFSLGLLKNYFYLEESGLAALSDGIDAVGIQAPRRRDGCVIIDPVFTVYGPVVVAMVVNVSVAIIDQTVLANLL